MESPLRDEWQQWNTRASEARANLPEQVGPDDEVAFDSTIWGEHKRWLLDHVFRGRCAYCEGKFDVYAWGDAEHYRPKGRVTERVNGSLQPITGDDGQHPGYFWLAYDWENLVPACQRCNSGSGKRDQFPIDGTRAFGPEDGTTPDELDALEHPLLLHPWRGPHPEAHLEFLDLGLVAARGGSDFGNTTITVCDLKREPLTTARQQAQEEAERAFWEFLIEWRLNGKPVAEQLTCFVRERPFSRAVLDHLARHRERLETELAAALGLGTEGK